MSGALKLAESTTAITIGDGTAGTKTLSFTGDSFSRRLFIDLIRTSEMLTVRITNGGGFTDTETLTEVSLCPTDAAMFYTTS